MIEALRCPSRYSTAHPPMRLIHTLCQVFACLLVLAAQAPSAAWSNHALGTGPALEGLAELRAAPAAVVEPLEAFLRAEGPALEQLLAAEERWARGQMPSYPPRPDALAFRAVPPGGAEDTAAEWRRRFVATVRINPESRLALFLQRLPGQDDAGHDPLNWSRVTTLAAASAQIAARFVTLREGERVAPIDVLTTASDEPDYGLDIGLYEDNGTAAGKAYGMGRQPFGNAAYEYSSQAPLHMGYFHEAAIVYRAAPYLGRTLPEYRVHLWQSLAVHALKTGHAYWGWRFAGWALHHVQDLTQPYHARVLPGIGTARMLWISLLDMAGWHGPKDDAITLVTNRHTAIENYQYHLMQGALRRGETGHPALQALRGPPTDRPGAWRDDTLREALTRESADAGDALDATLEASLPARYIAEPGYNMGVTEPGLDLATVVAQGPAEARQRLDAMLDRLLGHFGAGTRAFVLDLLARTAPP
jgi:hypothetical protein